MPVAARDPPTILYPARPPRAEHLSPLAWARLRRAPLVPVALAATAGLLLDRYHGLPLPAYLALTLAALAAWAVTRAGRPAALAPAYFCLAAAGFAAAYHHLHREVYAPDDVGEFAAGEPRLVRLQGRLAEEPAVLPPGAAGPLVSRPRGDLAVSVLEVTALRGRDDWQPASGRARLTVQGRLDDLHVGDEVEVLGWLARPEPPGNPGERDQAALLRDARIRAEVHVRKTDAAVTRLREGWPGSVFGWLAVVRGWGRRGLEQALPPEQAGVAAALLLGDATAMSGPEWDRYARAGVVHALAISGQHLVVLGWFAWFVLRLMGLRRRQAAAAVALFLLAYALLTGGRPAAMRAAVMVGVFCGGVLLVRPVLPANALACAWLAVLMLNPTDPFTPGCQLSFAATAVLMAAASWFRRPELSPVEELTEESRPAWLRAVRELGRMTLVLYAVNLILWLAATPLIAHWNHVVSPVAVLVGPPVVLLSSLALVAGFLLLLALPLGGWLAAPFAWLTGTLLEMCQGLVGWANAAPGGCLFLAGPGLWWLAGFYAGLAALLLLAGTGLPVRRWALTGGAAWLGVGLLAGIARPVADELRVTFLAVGHGGCTVLETPDGRVLLYDAGAITGPEVTRRRIAPFLWHRGVGRIDEVFLSHADLDHFNGLPDLLERFPVGQITLAGGFTARDSPGVELLLRRADELGVPVRTAVAGDRFAAGEVTLEVLHPPREGMEGDENVRSLVLRVTHAGHTILLTGDLEGPGLARVLNLPPGATDVLMAPHHGSRRSNTPELADTTRPRLVVSSQAAPLWPPRQPSPYEERRIPVLATHEHGAVTLLSHRGGLVVETFRGNQRWAVRPEGAP